MAIKRVQNLVSIVISCYNVSSYIGDCLDSIFGQTYKQKEVIIVDDHSTDGTYRVIEKWIKQKNPEFDITICQLPRNVGFAGALNTGYALSKGEYIAIHDADDISHPERIEKQVNFFKQNPDYDLVGTNYTSFIDGNFDEKKTVRWIKYGEDISLSYKKGKHCVCHGTLLVRGTVIDKIGGLTRKINGAEDYEFIAKCLENGYKVENLREELYYYRLHDKQRSREFYKTEPVKTNIQALSTITTPLTEKIVSQKQTRDSEKIIVSTKQSTSDIIAVSLTETTPIGEKAVEIKQSQTSEIGDQTLPNTIALEEKAEGINQNKTSEMDDQTLSETKVFEEKDVVIKQNTSSEDNDGTKAETTTLREKAEAIKHSESLDVIEGSKAETLTPVKKAEVIKLGVFTQINNGPTTEIKGFEVESDKQTTEVSINGNSLAITPQVKDEPVAIRVLMVMDSFNIGGTETHVHSLAKELTKKGIGVVFVGNGGKMLPQFRELNCPIYEITFPLTLSIPLQEEEVILEQLDSIIQNEKITIVHTHQTPSGYLTSKAASKRNIPTFFTVHGTYYPKEELRKVLDLTTQVVTVSPPVDQYVRQLFHGKDIQLIRNGIDTSTFRKKEQNQLREELGIPLNAPVIMYSSRIAWEKGNICMQLLKACQVLKLKNMSDLHVLIVGEGVLFGEVEKLVKRIHRTCREEFIHLVGEKMNIEDYYNIADCVVGTGRVALEAMACEKPVLAVGNHGYFGLVNSQNYESAWKCYFGDHHSLKKSTRFHFVKDLRRLFFDMKKNKNYSHELRKKVIEDYNVEKSTIETLELYKKNQGVDIT
jgi:L-malate glycosyltransferase